MSWRSIVRAAVEQGFRLEAGTRHVLMCDRYGRVIAVGGGGTPGDWRSERNLLAILRRAGLRWPWTTADRRRSRSDGRRLSTGRQRTSVTVGGLPKRRQRQSPTGMGAAPRVTGILPTLVTASTEVNDCHG